MAEQTVRVAIVREGPLELLARAIRARLEIVFPPNRFHHAFIPARMTIAEWKKVLERPPFVGVSFQGFTTRHSAATRGLNVDAKFGILTVTENVRGREFLLFGDASKPGAMIMAQVAGVILHGHDFDDLGAARVVQSEPVAIEDFEAEGMAMMGTDIVVDNMKLPMAALLGGDEFKADALDTLVIDWGFGATDTIPTGEI